MLRAGSLDQRAAMEASERRLCGGRSQHPLPSPCPPGRRPGCRLDAGTVRAAAVLIHRASHAAGRTIGRCPHHNRLPGSRRPPPAASPKTWSSGSKPAKREKVTRLDRNSRPDMMSPLALFPHRDSGESGDARPATASVWTWAIIFSHALRLRRINRQTEVGGRDSWAASDIDGFHNIARSRASSPPLRSSPPGSTNGAGRPAAARSTAPAPASA